MRCSALQSSPSGVRSNLRAFRSDKQSPADAGTAPNREVPEEQWRRRPDLNRGWRFCRFNGVVHRVVSCWSLVGPAPPFYLVLGPLLDHVRTTAAGDWSTAILPLSPSARAVRGTGVLLRFVARIPDLIGRMSVECIGCAARNYLDLEVSTARFIMPDGQHGPPPAARGA